MEAADEFRDAVDPAAAVSSASGAVDSVPAPAKPGKRPRSQVKQRRVRIDVDDNGADMDDDYSERHSPSAVARPRKRSASGRLAPRVSVSASDMSLSTPGIDAALLDAATRVHDAAAAALSQVLARDGAEETGGPDASTFHGICRVSARGNKWQSTLYAGGRSHHLGWFCSARTAAHVYDLWCLRFKGADAVSRLNFKEESCRALGWTDGVPPEFKLGVPGTYDMWSSQHPAAAAGRKGPARRFMRVKRAVSITEPASSDAVGEEDDGGGATDADAMDAVVTSLESADGGTVALPDVVDSDAAALMAHLVGDMLVPVPEKSRRSSRPARMSSRMLASLETEEALKYEANGSPAEGSRSSSDVNVTQRQAVAQAAAASLSGQLPVHGRKPGPGRPPKAKNSLYVPSTRVALDGLPMPSADNVISSHATLVHELVSSALVAGVHDPVNTLSHALAAYAPAVSSMLAHAPSGVDAFNTSAGAFNAAWNAGTAAVYHHALQQASLANMSMNPGSTMVYMNAVRAANGILPVPPQAFIFPYGMPPAPAAWPAGSAEAGVPYPYHVAAMHHAAAAQQQAQYAHVSQTAAAAPLPPQ